jgi:hypothetical protein
MQFDCGTCHKPHAASPAASISPCTECHVMAEEAGLHARHLAKGCTSCHVPHLWVAGPPDCLRCHEKAERHAAGKGCTSCHAFRGKHAAK